VYLACWPLATVWLTGPVIPTVKSNPVPESATVAGVATAEELTVSAPDEAPPELGWKTTEAVQFAPAARLPVQVFCAMLNGALAASESDPISYPLELVTVTACAVLDCPAATTAKAICDGFVARPVESCPDPFNCTVAGATPEVDDDTASVAAIAPVADGVNTICALQLLPLSSVAPHVIPVIE